MKKPPKILKVFASIERNEDTPLLEYKVRVIRYDGSVQGNLFDIREYVTSETSMHFTQKGVSLTLSQTKYLYKVLPEIITFMELVETNHVLDN